MWYDGAGEKKVKRISYSSASNLARKIEILTRNNILHAIRDDGLHLPDSVDLYVSTEDWLYAMRITGRVL